MLHEKQSKIYLDPCILQWPCYLESWSYGDESKIKRSYDTLEYAASLIEGDASEFKLADAVMNLKRAINVRLKLLDFLYHFSDASSLKKIGALERLEIVGLAKPFLIKQLFELRNDIEHNDALPPDFGRLKELIDITWYFLRSTDSAARNHSRTLLFEDPNNNDEDSGLWLNVKEFSGKSSEIKISGWLSRNTLSRDEGWEISVNRLEMPPVSMTEKGLEYFKSHGTRHPDHRFVVGTICPKSKFLVHLWSRMFSLT